MLDIEKSIVWKACDRGKCGRLRSCFATKKQQDIARNRLLFSALSVSLRLPFLASTACFDALATNSSLDCLLYASRSQCERLLQGAGGYGIRPYGVGCVLLPKPWTLWIVGDAICLTTIPQPAMLSAFGPGRKHSIAPRFGYQQHTVLFA